MWINPAISELTPANTEKILIHMTVTNFVVPRHPLSEKLEKKKTTFNKEKVKNFDPVDYFLVTDSGLLAFLIMKP